MWCQLVVILCFLHCFQCAEILYHSNEYEETIAQGRIGHTEFIIRNQVPVIKCRLPNGKSGECKPFYECPQDEFKQGNTAELIKHFCVKEENSVGVCCPVGLSQKLAGNLPAIASTEETPDQYLQAVTATNRGCGVSTRDHGRQIGATEATPRDWPWMAFVAPEGALQYAGGVLITDRHVLTAAHITNDYNATELIVRLGEYDYNRENDSRTYNFRVVEKREHEFFDKATYKNDIAVLKIERASVFNTYVWPICLPPLGMDLVNKTVVIIGWGTLFYKGDTSNVLMEVSVPVWERQKCVSSFNDEIFEENFCAAGYEGGKDACQGDSGGPVMYQMPSGRWTVVGIMSWGLKCGEPHHPGVHTSPDIYLNWIMKNSIF